MRSFLEESPQDLSFTVFRMSSFPPCCSGFRLRACRVSEPEKVTACRASVPCCCCQLVSRNLLTCDKNKMSYFCHCGASSNENVFSEVAWSPLTPVELVAFLLRFLDSLNLIKVYRDSETTSAPYCMLCTLNSCELLTKSSGFFENRHN